MSMKLMVKMTLYTCVLLYKWSLLLASKLKYQKNLCSRTLNNTIIFNLYEFDNSSILRMSCTICFLSLTDDQHILYLSIMVWIDLLPNLSLEHYLRSYLVDFLTILQFVCKIWLYQMLQFQNSYISL